MDDLVQKPSGPRKAETLPEIEVREVSSGSPVQLLHTELPPGTRLSIFIDTHPAGGISNLSSSFEPLLEREKVKFSPHHPLVRSKEHEQRRVPQLIKKVWQKVDLDISLFALALLVYLLTRFIGLPDFPIYFFCDEAVQTVLAADLVRDGFYNVNAEFLPTFFQNTYQYNLGPSVYLQVIPYLLFGKSVWVTRGVCALLTVLAALSVGLVLKTVFKVRNSWVAVMLLSMTPAWFLHSRTAFETSLATSFYAASIYFYLVYRTASQRNLFPALIMAAMAFYTYSPMRVVILMTGFLFLVIDLPYHWRQRRVVLFGLGLAAVLVIPFIRFQVNHPGENLRHLNVLSSYWVSSLPVTEKFGLYFSELIQGLDPFYWFFPNDQEMARHTMKGYGHILSLTLPLLLLGLVISISQWRQPQYRILIFTLLAAPCGAAVIALGVTRALGLVIPVVILCALGLVFLMRHAEKLLKSQAAIIAFTWVIFFAMAAINFSMLRNAIISGPTWYQDYGLGGMQYGARQLFDEIETYLEQNPTLKLIVSPSWANGADTIARFFFSDPLPFEIGSIDGHITNQRPLDEDTVFVMIGEELNRVYTSGKFVNVRIEKVISYPDKTPGFYFVRLKYAPDIEKIFTTEAAARRVLQEQKVVVADELAEVQYSYLDMGEIYHIFDNDPETLIRTMEANPLQVDIYFPEVRTIQQLSVRVGGVPTRISISMQQDKDTPPVIFEKSVPETPDPRLVDFSFDPPQKASVIHLLVKTIRDKEPSHVHLWEVTVK